MKENIIKEKSFDFALEVIESYKKLKNENEFVLSKQLLRSGTSIGANIEEATAAESRKDFLHKMSIASKEARETMYWIKLLDKSQIINFEYKTYLEKIQEIIRILTAIVKSTSNETIKN